MVVRIFSTLALVLLQPMMGFSAGAAAQVAEPGVEALASRLVEMTFAADVIRRDSVKACTTNFRAGFLRHPQASTAPAGLPDAMADAGCAKLDEMLGALLPELMANASASYVANLTPKELRDAITFFSTSAGTKLVAATPTLATGGDVREVLNSEEIAQFAEFSRSSAGRKIEALKPRQAANIAALLSRALTAAEPQITAAALAAGRSFMQAHKSGKR